MKAAASLIELISARPSRNAHGNEITNPYDSAASFYYSGLYLVECFAVFLSDFKFEVNIQLKILFVWRPLLCRLFILIALKVTKFRVNLISRVLYFTLFYILNYIYSLIRDQIGTHQQNRKTFPIEVVIEILR